MRFFHPLTIILCLAVATFALPFPASDQAIDKLLITFAPKIMEKEKGALRAHALYWYKSLPTSHKAFQCGRIHIYQGYHTSDRDTELHATAQAHYGTKKGRDSRIGTYHLVYAEGPEGPQAKGDAQGSQSKGSQAAPEEPQPEGSQAGGSQSKGPQPEGTRPKNRKKKRKKPK